MKKRRYNSSHDEYEMTDKQYKTLRRLAVLWFKVFLHNRFRIMKNILFFIFTFGFLYYFINYEVTSSQLEELKINSRANSIEQIQNVYNIGNYSSINKIGRNLNDVLVKLKNQYLKDRGIPDDQKYVRRGVIKKSWRLHCYSQLRKIIFLKTRVSDIEQTILFLNYSKTDLVYDVYEKAGYNEILSDLSNYYSKYLTEGQYNYIIRGFE